MFLVAANALFAQDWETIGSYKVEEKAKKANFNIESHETPYTELKIKVSGKNVNVGKIWIEFDSGNLQIVKVNQEVTPTYPITIDLAGNTEKVYGISLNFQRIDISAIETSIMILAK